MQSKGGLNLEGDDEIGCVGGKLSSRFLEVVFSHIQS